MLYVNMVLNKFNIHKDFHAFQSDIAVDQKYHAYHQTLIEQESGLPKIIRVYEKHRSKKAKYFNTQLSRVVREGRKYGYDFGGDSQRLEDWDKSIMLQMGCIFLFSLSASPDEQEMFARYLGFNKTHFALANKHLRGRHSQYGQPFLLIVQDIDGASGSFVVPLYYLASANKLWAFKTDHDDYLFKQALEDKLQKISPQPILHARLILANQFPSSSIKRARERLISMGTAADNDQAVQCLLQDCIAAFYQLTSEERVA